MVVIIISVQSLFKKLKEKKEKNGDGTVKVNIMRKGSNYRKNECNCGGEKKTKHGKFIERKLFREISKDRGKKGD